MRVVIHETKQKEKNKIVLRIIEIIPIFQIAKIWDEYFQHNSYHLHETIS